MRKRNWKRDKKTIVIRTEGRPWLLAILLIAVLKQQKRLEPLIELLFGLVDDAEAVVLGVEGNDVLALDVLPLVDVEAAAHGDGTLGRLFVVELLLGVVVLEAGIVAGRLGPEHKVLLLEGLELFEVGGEDDGPRRLGWRRGHAAAAAALTVSCAAAPASAVVYAEGRAQQPRGGKQTAGVGRLLRCWPG